jgi:hypothetical protein
MSSFPLWISKARLLVLILHSQNLKDARSIHFARHLLLLTQALMVVSLFFEGMQMIVCLLWLASKFYHFDIPNMHYRASYVPFEFMPFSFSFRTCLSSHLGRNWLQLICMAMSGIFDTFFEVRSSCYCLIWHLVDTVGNLLMACLRRFLSSVWHFVYVEFVYTCMELWFASLLLSLLLWASENHWCCSLIWSNREHLLVGSYGGFVFVAVHNT